MYVPFHTTGAVYSGGSCVLLTIFGYITYVEIISILYVSLYVVASVLQQLYYLTNFLESKQFIRRLEDKGTIGHLERCNHWLKVSSDIEYMPSRMIL